MSTDRIEDHGEAVGNGNKVRCRYCGKEVGGYSRLKHHLAEVGPDVLGCTGVSNEIKESVRIALIEKKKDRLLKEVGALYHPELPLKRNYTAGSTSSETCRSPLKRNSSAPGTSTGRSANGNSKKNSRQTPSMVKPEPVAAATLPTSPPETSSGHSAVGNTGRASPVVKPEPMEAAVNAPDSDMVGNVDKVLKKEVMSDSALLAARSIGRFFYESGLDLRSVNLPSFQKMVDSVISCGAGYTAPRHDELSGWVLQDELHDAIAHVDSVKPYWEVTGCSILLDGWTDKTGKCLMGFLVDCPQGRIFLKSVDATDAVHDVDALFRLIDNVVEEVGVKNVVQVVAHETSRYMEVVGKKLMDKHKTVFWTLCADHCINLILDKIGMMDHLKKVIADAKTITRFIYSHTLLLDLMKKYITGGDLVKISKLRSVAVFLTLENMVSQKTNLMQMFGSAEWNCSIWASRTKGKDIRGLVWNPSFWAAVDYVTKITNPLVRVLDQIKADRTPMGFLYDAMDRAKEAIQKNIGGLGGGENKCQPLWDIIDDIWDNYLHSALHSAGYYLNPSLFYSGDFHIDAEVTNGVTTCVVRMVEDQHSQNAIVQQLDAYQKANGGFASDMAIAQRTNVPPVLWWTLHGESSPELQRLAIKILSQTCSGAARCNIRKCYSERLHVTGINCLERQRLADVEFVQNNLQLRHNGKGMAEELNPSDEWIAE